MIARARLFGEAGRFLIAGLFNTLLTLAVYQLLLMILPPRPAYAATWAIGLAFVAIVYPVRVFGAARPTRATRAGVVLVYAAGFLIGVLAIQPAARLVGEQAGILPVLVLTTLFNFVAMRAVIGLTARNHDRPR